MIDRDYVLAGHAIFTVDIPVVFRKGRKGRCKPHYTYKVELREANEKNPEAWFVKVLTGPDNETTYTYLGKVDPATGNVVLTQKSIFVDTSWPVRVLRHVLLCIWKSEGEKIEAAGWAVHHAGYCPYCGRKLTSPISLRTGIGPECARRVR